MSFLESLDLFDCLWLAIFSGIAILWIGVYVERAVRRFKSRRRRSALNRLNHSGYFKTMDHHSYRAWR